MKKFSIIISSLALGLASAMTAGAAVNVPIYYSEDFQKLADEGDFLPENWTTYGIEANPVSELYDYFVHDGKLYDYVLMQIGSTSVPMCNTNFTGNQKADQWMITPEIEVREDFAELAFTACVTTFQGYLGNNENTFEIRVSDSGTDKADFGEPIYSGKIKGSATSDLKSTPLVCRLNGYGGKKVRIAFICTGCNAGLFGVTNLKLGDYQISLDNKTVSFAETGQSVAVSVNVGLKAPTECPGFKATLKVNGEENVLNYSKPFGRETGNTLIYQLVDFKDYAIKVGDEMISYSVDITPDYDGAPTSTISGVISVPKVKYLNNVVVEEATATGCGYCPAGTGSLEYYLDNFRGSETQGKAICIAVHGVMNWVDPMSEGVYNSYTVKLMDSNNNTGLPQARFNRATVSKMPWDNQSFMSQINKTSNNSVEIKKVAQPENVVAGSKIDVTFATRCGYDTEDSDLNAAVVLIENDVQGFDKTYNQENYFYNATNADMANIYGAWLVPYMQEFVGGPKEIPFNKIKYQHVARGIFPSFTGEPIQDAFVCDVPDDYTISFNVPETVDSWENSEVIVLIFNNVTGEIVASDIIEATGTTGVEDLFCDTDVKVAGVNGKIVVNAPEGSQIDVYGIDGINLFSVRAASEETVIASNGMVVVRVINNGKVSARKLVL